MSTTVNTNPSKIGVKRLENTLVNIANKDCKIGFKLFICVSICIMPTFGSLASKITRYGHALFILAVSPRTQFATIEKYPSPEYEIYGYII